MEVAEYWVRRFEHFGTQSRLLFDKTVQLIALCLTFLSAAASVALAYSRYEIVVFIPLVMLVVWAIAARMLHEQLVLAAYRDHADENVRSLLGSEGDPFAVWHSLGGARVRDGLANRYLFFVLAIASVLLMAGSVILCFTNAVAPVGWLIAESVAVALGLWLGSLAFAKAEADIDRLYVLLRSQVADGRLAKRRPPWWERWRTY